MILKTRYVMGLHPFKTILIYFIFFSFSGCSLPEENQIVKSQSPSKDVLFKMDTVKNFNGKKGLTGIGLKRLSNGKKHGIWSFYKDDVLIRMETFKEDENEGPYLVFGNNGIGGREIQTMAYEKNGTFEGPGLYLNPDGLINFYNFFRGGRPVVSIILDSTNIPEIKVNDSITKFRIAN
jgi:hypothetical protein